MALALIKLVVSAALVWLCLRAVGAGELVAALSALPAWAAALGVVCVLANGLLCAWRWRIASRALGLNGPSLRDAVRWMSLSITLSQVLPSTVGGDAYRAGALARQEGLAAAARSVILDRLVGLWVLAGMGALAAFATPGFEWLGALGVAGVLAVPLLRRLPKFGGEVAKLVALLRSPAIFALSIAIHAATIGAVIALAWGLKPGTPLWWQMALLTPAAMLAAAVPVSVGGWGVREAALVLGATAFGIPQGEALAVSVAYGVALLANGALGALIWAVIPEKKQKGSEQFTGNRAAGVTGKLL